MLLFINIYIELQINKVKQIRGKTAGEFCRNAMRETMISGVAAHFSWSGQKRSNTETVKEKFKDKKICMILIGKMAITLNSPNNKIIH